MFNGRLTPFMKTICGTALARMGLKLTIEAKMQKDRCFTVIDRLLSFLFIFITYLVGITRFYRTE